jgi:hypothetical protein
VSGFLFIKEIYAIASKGKIIADVLETESGFIFYSDRKYCQERHMYLYVDKEVIDTNFETAKHLILSGLCL